MYTLTTYRAKRFARASELNMAGKRVGKFLEISCIIVCLLTDITRTVIDFNGIP